MLKSRRNVGGGGGLEGHNIGTIWENDVDWIHGVWELEARN